MRLVTRLTVASILALASSPASMPTRADGGDAATTSAPDPGFPPSDSQDNVPPERPAPKATEATRDPGAASGEPVETAPPEDVDPGFPPSDSQDDVPPTE